MAEKTENGYIAHLPTRDIELKDDAKYLDYFANKQPIEGFLTDSSIWGEDLSAYKGFVDTVKKNVEQIKKGVCLL